jgi:DNA-binding SARP family transcriptional activator
MALHISLLGQFRLFSGEQSLDLPSRPAQSLLAYLVMQAGMVQRREKLAGLHWPEAIEANARSYLRQGLWRIRKSLEGASLDPDEFLQTDDVSVVFLKEADYWLDVGHLLASIESGSIDQLREAVSLYRGELLPGFYDEWIEPERERIAASYHQKMNSLLGSLLEAGYWSQTIEWGEEWIRLAHSPEAAYRALMRAYAGLGDQSMVRTIYQRCITALDRELGIEPSSGTRKLYEQLLHAEVERDRRGEPDQRYRGSGEPRFLDDTNFPQVQSPLLVARENELDELDGYLAQAISGQGRVAFVTGEAGSGKTSLLNEFSRRSLNAHAGLIVASGSCNAHTGIGDPYLPFREILGMLTGDVEGRWAAGVIDTEHARLLWQFCPFAARALVDTAPDLVNTFVHGPSLFERINAHGYERPDWLVQLREVAERPRDGTVAAMIPQSDLFEQYTRLLQTFAQGSPCCC